MNIEQKELINIIREELAEALGMDASYDRQNLTMRLRDFLDEYTGDDLQAAMDALENVQAMLRYEMNMAAKEDEEVNEDLVDDPTKAEEAEAKQRAAQGEKTGTSEDSEDNPGEYVPTSEGSRSRRYDPRNYVGRDVGRRFTHGSDGKKPPTGLYGKRKYFKIK